MRGHSKHGGLVITWVVLSLLVVKDAHAYLDAATASFILQMVVGAVVFACFTVKVYWIEFKTIMRNMLWREKRNKDG